MESSRPTTPPSATSGVAVPVTGPFAEFAVERIQTPTLKRQIAARLREAILNRELLPGSRLVEARLAKDWGVAQTTLRDAMAELERQGLLVKHANRETVVRRFSVADLRKLFRVRTHLEALGAELAQSNLTPRSAAVLRVPIEQMRQAARLRDIPSFYRYDIEFHSQLARLADNEFLVRALAPLAVGPIAFVLAGANVPERLDYMPLAEDHEEIVQALETRSPEAIRKVIRRKLDEWLELQLTTMSAGMEGIE